MVRDTFSTVLGSGARVPEGLVEGLFRRFEGGEAYELFDDVGPFLRGVRRWEGEVCRASSGRGQGRGNGMPVGNVVVGVLTNSDPRVSSVLRSLGLSVGVPGTRQQEEVEPDIDFVLTSYEIGVEKPDPRAFLAAERIARSITRQASTSNRTDPQAQSPIPTPALSSARCDDDDDAVLLPKREEEEDQEDEVNDAMLKIHIGDDLQKDCLGAIRAGTGWHALLLDRTREEPESMRSGTAPGATGTGTPRAHRDDKETTALDAGVRRIGSLAEATGVIERLWRMRGGGR